jgi:acetyltransferase-like isoleucine patch superfamily enzyme
MSVKLWVKKVVGFVKCKRYGVRANFDDNIYIGGHTKILGGKQIKLEKNVVIRPEVQLWCAGKELSIGHGSEIGQRSRISITNRCRIGNDVLFSPNVYITDRDHEYRNIDIPVIRQGIRDTNAEVEIGDGSYIGINSVIVGNVTIGKHCVIGANSVVTKSIPDYCVAVGSPAKVIKRYNLNSASWENEL